MQMQIQDPSSNQTSKPVCWNSSLLRSWGPQEALPETWVQDLLGIAPRRYFMFQNIKPSLPCGPKRKRWRGISDCIHWISSVLLSMYSMPGIVSGVRQMQIYLELIWRGQLFIHMWNCTCQMKRQTTDWKEVFAKHVSDKWLISRCIKNFYLFTYLFLGPHLWHMEVPRLGVKSELQLPAYTTATATPDPSLVCDLHCCLLQCQILNPLIEVRDWTFIFILVWFLTCWATVGTP